MESFKTPKGTILPLMSLKGKPYLQVAHRVMWFREDHPDWQIDVQTEIKEINGGPYVVGKAFIRDEVGKALSNASKLEPFADLALEKAETGAIGRALGLLGYGTQFAIDLEEDDRLADAPVNAPQKKTIPNVASKKEFKKPERTPDKPTALFEEPILFGKYQGQRFGEVGYIDLEKYANWLKDSAKNSNKPMNQAAIKFCEQVKWYCDEQRGTDEQIPF